MTSSWIRGLMVLVGVVGLGAVEAAASQSSQPPFRWWRSEEFRTELRLTPEQVARIDKIFESTRPELRQEMDELARYDAKLEKLLETSTDEAILARQIDRVETARANLNKTRSLMITRMRLVLTAEQREQLKALYERWERRNRSSKPGGSDEDRSRGTGSRPAPESGRSPGC